MSAAVPGDVDRYFEDYVPGSVWELGSVSVSEAEIVAFGELYDPQPFHIDPVSAREGPFGGVIASGWHTCGLAMQRFVPNYLSAASSMASPGIDELRFPAPVRPGDRLRIVATVLGSRPSRTKPDRGIVRSQVQAFNADGVLVLSMVVLNMIRLAP